MTKVEEFGAVVLLSTLASSCAMPIPKEHVSSPREEEGSIEIYGFLEKIGGIYNIKKENGSCIGILHNDKQSVDMNRLRNGQRVSVFGKLVKDGCGKSLICSDAHCGPEMVVLENIRS